MTTDSVRGAYAGAGPGWATDASLVYRPLARHLVARSPVSLAGRLVLDAGAGTGAAGSLLAGLGARVVESDIEPTMLAHGRANRPSAVAADVAALPFTTGVFDAAIAAFVINHVADPVACLAELARVTVGGGLVLASTFSATRSPAKAAFDDAVRRHGWRSPEWYDVVSARFAAFGTVAQVRVAARAAGLAEIDVVESAVDVGVDDADSIVRYRLGMPHYTSWLAGLDAAQQRRAVDDAIAAIAALGEPFHPQVIELVASVAGSRR